jgi:hypothetical protein
MAMGAPYGSIGSFVPDEPITKLSATTRGKLLLVNAYDLLQAELLEPRKLLLALRGLRRVARKLPDGYTDAQLVSCLAGLRNPVAPLFQAIANELPPDDLTITAVRTFDDVRTMLTEIQKVHKDDRRIRAALAPRPPVNAIRSAADTLNEYIPRMPSLALGIPFNLFWATTIDEITSLERKSGAGDNTIANDVRDRLGLCHIHPDRHGRTPHLFVFEGLRTLGEMRADGDFRITRPTIIDGFDNPRFRQLTSDCSTKLKGCGLTVDLHGGVFADGAPELVATKIPVKGNFRCRWIGNVSSMPGGTDDTFLDFISCQRSLPEIEHEVLAKNLRDVAVALQS